MQALDADSGPRGQVRYSLSPDTAPAARQFFTVDAETGGVMLRAALQAGQAGPPWRVVVTARDNPGLQGESRQTSATVSLA